MKDDILPVFGKSFVGMFGTASSIALQNASTIASIIVALCTAAYMIQQYLNAREKGRAFKEDRSGKPD